MILYKNVDRKRTEMTTRSEREKAQKLNEQHQAILSKMLREDDNKYCADCEAKGEMTYLKITSTSLLNLCGILMTGIVMWLFRFLKANGSESLRKPYLSKPT